MAVAQQNIMNAEELAVQVGKYQLGSLRSFSDAHPPVGVSGETDDSLILIPFLSTALCGCVSFLADTL